jgi:hypothetical protein
VKEKAEIIKAKIKQELANRLFNLKVDCATRLNRPFFGVNVQYIEKSQIVVRTLGVFELEGSHTGANMAKHIEKILKQCNLDAKQIFSITTDNARDMVKMCSVINRDTDDDECESEDENSESENPYDDEEANYRSFISSTTKAQNDDALDLSSGMLINMKKKL